MQLPLPRTNLAWQLSKEFCLYYYSVTYSLFLIRNSGVLDSSGIVLAKASLDLRLDLHMREELKILYHSLAPIPGMFP